MKTSLHATQAAAKLARLPIGCLPCERESIVQEAIDAALEQVGYSPSSMGVTYHCLHGEEGCGTHGTYGVRLLIAHDGLPDLSTRRDLDNESPEEKAIHHAGYEAMDLLKSAIMTYVISRDPKAQAARVAERAQIVGLFAAPIFVQEIPNGYDPGCYSKHLPWFLIDTTVGRFKIGWRRHVINIDWSETQGTKLAKDLFPAEDVIKGDRYIHAWTVDKAREYVATIIGSVS